MSNHLLPLTIISILIQSVTVKAEEITVQQTLTPELCQQLMINHVPAADIEYQPEIDAEGNAVPAADLKGSTNIALPKKIIIPLRLNVQKFLNTPKEAIDSLKEQADLGSITLHQDGRLYYDNQPLFDQDQQAIKQACQKIM